MSVPDEGYSRNMSGIFKLFLPDEGYSRNMSGIFKLFVPDEGYSRNMSVSSNSSYLMMVIPEI
jgi:hypothetical protein